MNVIATIQSLKTIGDVTPTANWVGSALVLAFISMIAVAGVFYYLNRQLKRQYLNLWTIAWICYALHLLAAIGLQKIPDLWLLLLIRRICIGISGLLMFWGSFQLTNRPRPIRELYFAVALMLLYCFVTARATTNAYWLTVGMFGLLGSSGIYTGYIYLKRRATHHGATILGGGFVLWGGHLLLFPFVELSATMMGVSYLVSAGLAVMIAIAMATVVEREVNVVEKSYRSLFDASSDAVFLVDMWKLTIHEANRAAERLTKYRGDVLQGMSFRKIFPCFEQNTGNVLQNQRTFNTIFRPYQEVGLVRDGGKKIACEGEVVIAEWRQRMVFQVNVREVGERRKLEEQVKRSEKLSALGQLVAGVAHELNNPLAVIMGNAQLLAARQGLDESSKEALLRILRQSERAGRIIGDLLAYSRPSEPNKVPMDLNRTIYDVIEWRHAKCAAGSVVVRTRLLDSLPPTKADRVQVEQIVTNLINNAVDALKDRPLPREIEISTQETTTFLRVCVRDNGPGMTPEIRDKIFDPFFTTKAIGQGTGLGLAICSTYIQEHRGKIWVESEPGKGASFFFDLPLLHCENGVPTDTETFAVKPPSPALTTGQRLLIIDDEPDIAQLLEMILTDSGYQITTASNGNDALQIMSNENFDAVLSDMRMPGLDGQALYKRVLEIKPALARRVIFVTGDTHRGPTRDFINSTGNLWVSKPFRIDEVINRVQEAIKRQPMAVPTTLKTTGGRN
jgi:two-component system, NtrC family, sensor kinase